MRRGVGLGRNFSDYDQLTLRASMIVGPGVLLEPEVTVLRQGQGDFRLPYPTVAQYASTPTLFAGTVTRTIRLALGGSAAHGRWTPTGSARVHVSHNGPETTRLAGSVAL